MSVWCPVYCKIGVANYEDILPTYFDDYGALKEN